MAAPVIAIDFGTTRTKVGYFDSNRREPKLVELGRETRAIIPSIFYVPFKGDRLVGDDAQDMLDQDPEGIIIGLKKEIHKLGKKRLGRGRPSIDRVELASTLFCFVRSGCSDEVFHVDVVQCVLTVPVTFEEQKRERIRQAAELAGFRDIAIVDEPVAAAKYWLATSGQTIADTVVVCDVGGGTTDLALLRYRDGHFAPVPDVPPAGFTLGGNHVDENIWEDVLGNDATANVADSCRSAFLARLRRAKELLTRDHREQIPLALGETKLTIPRTVVEERTREFVEEVAKWTRHFFERCQAVASVQDSPILLVGGASRLAGLKDALEQLAPGRVYQWNYSDYATVLGAVECPASAPTWVSGRAVGPVPASTNMKPPVTVKATPTEHVTTTEPSRDARDFLARVHELLEQAQQGISEPSSEDPTLREQQLNDAVRHAQAACDLEPEWPDAFYVKGKVLSEQSEYTLAAAAVTACLRLEPEYPEAWGLRGLCKFKSGDFLGARQDFDQEIQRRPSETSYRLRAAACVRIGDAAAGFADLRSAMELSEEEISRACLCAIAGFLLHRRLKNPTEAVPFYGRALSSLSVETTSDEASAFTEDCQTFDILKSMITAPLREAPGVQAAPVASVQRHLWQAIMAIGGECDRSTVATFVEHCGKHDVADDEIWKIEPEFCRHRADICAADGDGDGAVVWLKRLWEQRPEYDVRTISEDPGIKSAAWQSGLRDLLKVKLAYEEDHGALLNHVTITNESAFRLTAIEVTVLVTRKDGKPGPPILRRLDSLAPGESHEWEDVFQGGGWFGRNIGSVTVDWKCAEGAPATSDRVLTSTSNAESSKVESSSSDVADVRVACPQCRKDNVIAPSNVGNDFRCIHCGETITGPKPSGQAMEAGETSKWEAPCPHCGQPSYTMLSTGKCPHCDSEDIAEVEAVAEIVELEAVPDIVEAEAVADIVEAEAVAEQDAPKQRRTRRRWYYSIDDKKRQGPVSALELRALIATGIVKREHYVSKDGKGWARADKLKGVNWP